MSSEGVEDVELDEAQNLANLKDTGKLKENVHSLLYF